MVFGLREALSKIVFIFLAVYFAMKVAHSVWRLHQNRVGTVTAR